ncbi:uncharacterized protein BP01DRAFT_288252 [Aspergillus saccharolyticus JOP 1030-1]|uniref:Uncharacterized protein n=1 Tax=Aspergillus saccharolyticus JOP 1030-1 TaxID=1450539 RepID=A0A318ZX12_9EURO|nr:hypothetical protein BP01DRAFT_288252 [Aspergillus saccharolyticus JOP 1030-1]PYH48853.1 hypothetical protein BP01DRAFT_288252 [Aspergillus saccharolyticus JOP 1030-1]
MAQLAMNSRLLRCQNASTLGRTVGSYTQNRTYLSSAKVPSFDNAPKKIKSGLNKFRNEVFIPLNLSEQQKLLIYRKKHQGTLDEHPVTVAISEEEEYRLQPMEFTAQPRNSKANELIRRMKTEDDWKQLPAFLTALHNVNRKLNLEMVVRRAGMNDAMKFILAAAQAKDTGFSLRSPGLVQKIFFELHLHAQKHGFKGPEVDRMLRLAQSFVDLMGLPRHVNNNPAKDPRRRPAVIGVLLELSAARALDKFGGKDTDGLVRAYSERLLASLNNKHFRLEMKKPNLYRNWTKIDGKLEQVVPIYNALVLTQKTAIDATISKTMKDRAKTMRDWVHLMRNAAPNSVRKHPMRGLGNSRELCT